MVTMPLGFCTGCRKPSDYTERWVPQGSLCALTSCSFPSLPTPAELRASPPVPSPPSPAAHPLHPRATAACLGLLPHRSVQRGSNLGLFSCLVLSTQPGAGPELGLCLLNRIIERNIFRSNQESFDAGDLKPASFFIREREQNFFSNYKYGVLWLRELSTSFFSN